VVEGDKRLFNQYGVMLVNPARYPSVKKLLGQQFIDWLISTEGQNVIASYTVKSTASNSFIRTPTIRMHDVHATIPKRSSAPTIQRLCKVECQTWREANKERWRLFERRR
jgi:DNA primase